MTFVAAPLLGLPALQQVTALLIGLVLGAAVFVVAHAGVRIERTFEPEVVTPGRASQARVRVTNLGALPSTTSRWTDRLGAGLAGDASGHLPGLTGARGARSHAVVEYAIRGLRRGRHPVGPLVVQVRDPFGLVTRRHVVGAQHDLVVLPRSTELAPGGTRGADTDGASRPSPQQVGLGEDDVIARSYLPGDALKRVHWKATAHRGELMVRQEEQQVNPRAGVVLDTDATSFGTARDRQGLWEHAPDLEWAVSAAASIVGHLSRSGHAVVVRGVGTFERRVSDGEDSTEDVLVDLALLEPRVGPVVDARSARTGERSTVAVLGGLDVERARSWTSALADGGSVAALVSRSTRPAALDVLDAAGWRVVTYGPGDDVADLWAELDGGRRRAAS